tara:strand:- start:342 stop:812 length:471 start_codon:yes stop_codon:yes gene_type:complete
MYKKSQRKFGTSNYKRPVGGSKTDQLQNIKSMKEKLIGYEQVNNIDDVSIGTHVRYVTLVNEDGKKKQKFRLGGILSKNEPDYVRLQSKDFYWSVQKKHYDESKKKVLFKTVFFQKISQATIDKNVILQLQKEIKQLQKENKLLRNKLGISNHIRF